MSAKPAKKFLPMPTKLQMQMLSIAVNLPGMLDELLDISAANNDICGVYYIVATYFDKLSPSTQQDVITSGMKANVDGVAFLTNDEVIAKATELLEKIIGAPNITAPANTAVH